MAFAVFIAAEVGGAVLPHAPTHRPATGTDPLATAAPATGIGGGNAEGVSDSFARSDHDHTIRETGGPTNLTVGAIADGEYVRRVGTALVGGSPAPTPVTSTRVLPEAPCTGGTGHFLTGAGEFNFSGAIAQCSLLVSSIAMRIGGFVGGEHIVCSIYQVSGGHAAGSALLLGTATILTVGAAETNYTAAFDAPVAIEPGVYFLAFGGLPGEGALIWCLGFPDIEIFSANAFTGTHPMMFVNGTAGAPPASVDLSLQTQVPGARFMPSAWLFT